MKMLQVASFARSHRRLVSLIIGIGTLSVAAVALAAIVSGTSTSNASTQVTVTQLKLNRPSVSAGDLMLASVAINGGSSAVVDAYPSGWTEVKRTDNDTNVTLITYSKIASGSEPTDYTWNIHGQTQAAGGITPYSGVDSIDTSAGYGDNFGFGTTASTSAITTIGNNEEVVALFAADIGKTSNAGAYFSTVAGMTEKYDQSNTPFGPSTAADDAIQATAGTAGSKSTTISGGKPRYWAAQQIALRPVAIQYDAESSNFSSSPGTSITTSHTVAGSNTVLFASVTTTCTGPGDVVTGVTYNGTAMTQAG